MLLLTLQRALATVWLWGWALHLETHSIKILLLMKKCFL